MDGIKSLNAGEAKLVEAEKVDESTAAQDILTIDVDHDDLLTTVTVLRRLGEARPEWCSSAERVHIELARELTAPLAHSHEDLVQQLGKAIADLLIWSDMIRDYYKQMDRLENMDRLKERAASDPFQSAAFLESGWPADPPGD